MVCTDLAGQNKWDHCTHLTWNLGHSMKWDHYKHPLSYHFVLCWGDLFSLDYICGYQYELLRGQFVCGLYSFGGTEQVRPLHTPFLKTGSLTEVRPLQAPFHITLYPMLGCCFHIKSYLWVPKRTIQMSVSRVCAVLSGQNKWDHCTHHTSKLGHWLRRDHCKHPLLYHCVPCWGDVFSSDHIPVCQ